MTPLTWIYCKGIDKAIQEDLEISISGGFISKTDTPQPFGFFPTGFYNLS